MSSKHIFVKDGLVESEDGSNLPSPVGHYYKNPGKPLLLQHSKWRQAFQECSYNSIQVCECRVESTRSLLNLWCLEKLSPYMATFPDYLGPPHTNVLASPWESMNLLYLALKPVDPRYFGSMSNSMSVKCTTIDLRVMVSTNHLWVQSI